MTNDDDLVRRGDVLEAIEAQRRRPVTRGGGPCISKRIENAVRALPAAVPSPADAAARELAEWMSEPVRQIGGGRLRVCRYCESDWYVTMPGEISGENHVHGCLVDRYREATRG